MAGCGFLEVSAKTGEEGLLKYGHEVGVVVPVAIEYELEVVPTAHVAILLNPRSNLVVEETDVEVVVVVSADHLVHLVTHALVLGGISPMIGRSS